MLDWTAGRLSRSSIFVEDTKDGGLAGWILSAVPDTRLKSRHSQLLDHANFKATKCSAPVPTTTCPVPLRCHCGDLRYNLLPSLKRYPAIPDTCTDCRLSTGSEIAAWASVVDSCLTMPDGSPLDLSSQSGCLTRYTSSPGKYRYFCSRCGATAFFTCDKKRFNDSAGYSENEISDGKIDDVAIGLLHAESGARAEEILCWGMYEGVGVMYGEEASDPELVRALDWSWAEDRPGCFSHVLPLP